MFNRNEKDCRHKAKKDKNNNKKNDREIFGLSIQNRAMVKLTALIVSRWFKTKQGQRMEIDRVQIQSIDFFKPCKPPQVKGSKTKVKHELHARSSDAK